MSITPTPILHDREKIDETNFEESPSVTTCTVARDLWKCAQFWLGTLVTAARGSLLGFTLLLKSNLTPVNGPGLHEECHGRVRAALRAVVLHGQRQAAPPRGKGKDTRAVFGSMVWRSVAMVALDHKIRHIAF